MAGWLDCMAFKGPFKSKTSCDFSILSFKRIRLWFTAFIHQQFWKLEWALGTRINQQEKENMDRTLLLFSREYPTMASQPTSSGGIYLFLLCRQQTSCPCFYSRSRFPFGSSQLGQYQQACSPNKEKQQWEQPHICPCPASQNPPLQLTCLEPAADTCRKEETGVPALFSSRDTSGWSSADLAWTL